MPSMLPHSRISDADLLKATQNTALYLSRLRKAEAFVNLPALDEMVPSSPEQMDADWRHASIVVATTVMTGRLHLSDLDAECYARLEAVWLDDIRQHLAYFNWINSREDVGFWSPQDLRQGHYNDACLEVRNLLVDRKVKDRLENFAAVRAYMSERYLDEFQHFNGEQCASLVEVKAAHIGGAAAREFAAALAAEYSRKFYENVISAVELCDRDACIAVLQALQHGGSLPGFPSPITCFEAAVAISFLDATTIQGLWKTGPNISRDTTF